MPASHRLPKRGLAFLLGVFLAFGFPFLPASLPPSSAQDLPAVQPSASLDQRARAAYDAGNGADAASLWQQAAEAARRRGTPLLQASMLSNLALSQLLQGKTTEAQGSLEAGFALLGVPAPAASMADKRTRAQLLRTRGRLLFDRSAFLDALTVWREATSLYEEIQADEDEMACLINQAVALQRMGNLSEARSLIEMLLTRPEISGQPRLETAALASLSDTLLLQGDVEEAQKRALRLRELAESGINADPLAIPLARRALADIHANQFSPGIGVTTLEQGGTSKSLGLLKDEVSRLALLYKAGDINRFNQLWPEVLVRVNHLPHNAAALDLRLDLANSLKLLLQSQSGESRPNLPSALESSLQNLLKRSLEDAKRLGNRRAISWAAGELGNLAESAGHLPEAESLTQQALGQAMALNMPELKSRWLGQLGSILRKQGNRSAAIDTYQQALEILHGLQLQLDITSTSAAGPSASRSSAMEISSRYIDLLTDSSSPTNEDLSRARKVMEGLQVAELNDFFRQPCFKSSEITSLSDKNVAVVYSFKLKDRLEVIIRLPGNNLLHHSELFNDGKALDRTVRNIQRQLQMATKDPVARANAISLLLPDAKQLYQWLLAKHEDDLKKLGINQLVFVSDASLRNVPMAALFDGKSFLSERYAMAVAPGMVLTPSTRRRGSRPRVLGAGLSTEIQEVNGLPDGTVKFPPLPAVEQELDDLERITGGTTLRNEKFTKQSLEQALRSGDYSVVHLATHGQFGSKPKSTFLISSTPKTTSLMASQGDLITVEKLPELLQPSRRRTGNSLDLLILSACQGALQDDKANIGLGAVAARSGASSTLASLWSVDDQATAKLMASFYQHWLNDRSKDGQPISKAEALRLAQAELRDNSPYSHPSYWAAFTLIGDWR